MMFRVQGAGFRVVRAVLEVLAIAGLMGIGARMPVSATQTSDGEALYEGACATCHDAPSSTSRAPGKDALRGRSPEAIVDSLTGGAMRYQGLSLSGAERRAIAVFLTGKAFGGDIAGATYGRCTSPPAFADPAAGVSWNGWSPTLENTHFQPSRHAGLTADQIPGLRLKWAFGFPDATSAWAQPTVAGGRLFVGSQNGTVYSLDPGSGCIIWTFTAQGSVRASISVSRAGAYFSDQKGYAYALDPTSGKLLWSRKVDNHPLIRLTGSPSLHGGTLYVPTSSYEEAGKGPSYACCTFRGSVVALDATTGNERWRAYTIAEEPKPIRRLEGNQSPGENPAWGPAGGAIWSAPTIDPKRGALYVGVGNTYAGLVTQPAANAVVAFALETGKMLWAKQVSAPDIFGCRAGAANCGERPGPDFDFGSSPALVRLASGRELIVIGNKSGIGYAMDPDKQGEIVWQYRAGKGSALGGIMWGAAVDGEQAYFPVADGNSPEPGGLHAVKLATGERSWFAPPPPPKCGARARGCNGAQSAALTAIAGVVFSPSNDGAIRAFSTKDGTIVWEFDTNRDFETVNRIKAHGGSMNGPAPVVVGGMVYVNSGYGAFGSRTGNVLLAFDAGVRLAADLRSGTQLVYASNGSDQPPWSVDAVEIGLKLNGDWECARLSIRRQPGQARADESRVCLDRGTLYGWDPARSAWVAQRPVGAAMTLTISRPNGDTVLYETGAASEETIGPFRLPVIATTVTTRGSDGLPKRRLRERYAITLATATGGAFEVPDPSAPTGWRTDQTFELREIRIGPRQ